jgi:acetolactate synthase regulatory subunit
MGGFVNALIGGQSTITSANSVVTLTVAGLFDTPVQLFGYSVEKAWDTAAVVVTETQISVDGRKTSGLVFNPVKQTFAFQADSPSVQIFEAIYAAQMATRDVYYIWATITLPATGESYVCNKGTLEDYNSVASAGKVLTMREFSISWSSIQPA